MILLATLLSCLPWNGFVETSLQSIASRIDSNYIILDVRYEYFKISEKDWDVTYYMLVKSYGREASKSLIFASHELFHPKDVGNDHLPFFLYQNLLTRAALSNDSSYLVRINHNVDTQQFLPKLKKFPVFVEYSVKKIE